MISWIFLSILILFWTIGVYPLVLRYIRRDYSPLLPIIIYVLFSCVLIFWREQIEGFPPHDPEFKLYILSMFFLYPISAWFSIIDDSFLHAREEDWKKAYIDNPKTFVKKDEFWAVFPLLALLTIFFI